MNSYININKEVWDYLRNQNTKIAKRILEALDYDIAMFYRYSDDIIIEKVWSGATIPDYLYNYIQKHRVKIIKGLVK